MQGKARAAVAIGNEIFADCRHPVKLDYTMSKVFLLWSREPESYSLLQNVLTNEGWQVVLASEDETLGRYVDDDDRLICLGLFSASSLPSDQAFLKFCSSGNSAIIAAEGEGHDVRRLSNLASKFGVEFHEDCVIRPNPYKHYHPKDALLEDFIANRGLDEPLRKHIRLRHDTEPSDDDDQASRAKLLLGIESGPRIVYARGCTLKLHANIHARTTTVMLTSSKWTVPNRQAICAFYRESNSNCRVIMLGSSQMMSDAYLRSEDNESLLKSLLDFIVDKSFFINISDARTIEIPEPVYGPDIERLVDTPIPCLQKPEALPDELDLQTTSLLDRRLFSVDSSLVPVIGRAYQDLMVPHEPLTLIKPNFLVKRPALRPATHGFLLRRPTPEADPSTHESP